MAKKQQGPRFLHQLRTSALPPNYLRNSAEKVSRLLKPAEKSLTSTCQLRSSTEKVSKASKPSVKPTRLSDPLQLSPRKQPNTQRSTSRHADSSRYVMHSSRTPTPPSSPHVMRSCPRSPSLPHVQTLVSSSTKRNSTPSANEEIAEASQVPHSPTTLEENDTNAAKKKRRGETRGMGIAKKKRSSKPIEIQMPEHLKRAVGENCQSYITEVGCIVRQSAPLQVKHWSDIDSEDVAALVCLVREKFKMAEDPHVDEAIKDYTRKRYSTWRYNMHKRYLQYETEEEALENKPDDVGEDDWNFLINWWNDPEFLEESERNKRNRDQLKITHCAGTKAFSRIRYENQNPETGEEPSRIDMFKLTRYREKKKAWVGDVAENAYDEMTKLQEPEQTNEESEKAMTDDEIYDNVLSKIVGPPRSGYIRGLGAGPKPKNSKVASHNRSQVQEVTRRADEAERRAAQLSEELEAMKAREVQQNEELDAMKARTTQQSQELEVVKAKQAKTDAVLRKLLKQLSSKK